MKMKYHISATIIVELRSQIFKLKIIKTETIVHKLVSLFTHAMILCINKSQKLV